MPVEHAAITSTTIGNAGSGTTAALLAEAADLAMYKAKGAGRNRVEMA